METCRIYLSGAMSGLNLEEMTKWRTQFQNAIKYSDYRDSDDFEKKPLFFDPTRYYLPTENYHKSEREAMEFDLYNLKKSDLVVVNLNRLDSIGTNMELILAKEYNIPVIAYGVNGQELHPWVQECCTRICDSLREAVTHIIDFYLC